MPSVQVTAAQTKKNNSRNYHPRRRRKYPEQNNGDDQEKWHDDICLAEHSEDNNLDSKNTLHDEDGVELRRKILQELGEKVNILANNEKNTSTYQLSHQLTRKFPTQFQ